MSGYDDYRRRNDEMNRRNEERNEQERARREEERRHRERFDADRRNADRIAAASARYRSGEGPGEVRPRACGSIKTLLLIFGGGAALLGAGAVLQRGEGAVEPSGAPSPDAIHQTGGDLLQGVPSSVSERTERALLDQVSCKAPPAAGIALQAMLRNELVRETDDGGDGSVVFVPTQPLQLLGFAIVRVTGWQEGEDGGAMPPFFRGPGTAPPNFISVTVTGTADEVRQRVIEQGMREAEYVPDMSQKPYELQGKVRQPQRFVPGVSVEEGDMNFVESPRSGVTTLTCSASEYDFAPQ